MKKFFLEIVVFICGAVVMAFEIIGSRMLGPYVGTSMVVWTSIIGVILLSLSLGYYWGGRIADKLPRADILSLIIFISALFMIFSTFLKDEILQLLIRWIDNIKVVSVIASLILFTVPSVLLGMVSPYAARIKMKSVEKSGSTVGNLYAISTVGSILGIFMAGFYLIPTFKITNILLLLSIVLIAVSLFLNRIHRFYFKNQISK
ncbi:MAG: fused MFS/spermidine synthase [Bacteroidales bacterium]|nr:fused MFS/spermidine synthase [Bacteroidales bacterium]